MLNDRQSTSAAESRITVRGRCRVAADSIVIEADLSEHQVVDTVLEDHDIDQMVEWARLAGHSRPVLHRVQLLHADLLAAHDLFRELPPGVHEVAAEFRRFTTEKGYAFCDLTRQVPLASLVHPGGERTALAAPPPVNARDLRVRTAGSNDATRSAVEELLACREAWPRGRHTGALLQAGAAIASDTSLGDDRLRLAHDLHEMATQDVRSTPIEAAQHTRDPQEPPTS